MPRRHGPSTDSPERGREPVRLAILLGSLAGLLLLSASLVRPEAGAGPAWKRASGPAPDKLKAALAAARLPVPLHDLTLTTTPGGPLVIGGATRAGSSTAQVERLQANGAGLAPVGTLAQPLREAAAINLFDETLVLGGRGASTLGLVQSLVPGAASQTVAHLPSALSDPSAVNLGGVAYLVGGVNGQTTSAGILQTTDGRAFVRIARLPTAVREAAVAALPERIYVFGGRLANGRASNEIQEYDRATQRSVIVGHLPQPLLEASAVTLDGVIYLLGGRIRGAASERIYRFDPERNVALPAGQLPQPIYDGAAASYQGHAYLVGGLGRAGNTLDSVVALH